MDYEIEDGIRTFAAPTLREALALVKSELGVDAIIINQEQVGLRVVVQASLEMPIPVEPTVKLNDEVDACAEEPQPTVVDLSYIGADIPSLYGTYRFIGASGVGKTTTLIKLMVEWVMHNGNRGIEVISTDDQRLAGTESLQLACQMLEVPLREMSGDRVSDQRGLFRQRELVLIDTPAWETNVSVSPVAELKDIWVLSAMHSQVSLQAQWQALPQQILHGITITHLDQPVDGGSLLEQMLSWKKPLYWLADGAQLPGGIDPASSSLLSQSLFGIDRLECPTIVV